MDAYRAELEWTVAEAQRILFAYLPPDGPSKDATISALLAIFDGPRLRRAKEAEYGQERLKEEDLPEPDVVRFRPRLVR